MKCKQCEKGEKKLMKKALSFRFSEAEVRELKDVAVDEDTTAIEIVRRALRAYYVQRMTDRGLCTVVISNEAFGGLATVAEANGKNIEGFINSLGKGEYTLPNGKVIVISTEAKDEN